MRTRRTGLIAGLGIVLPAMLFAYHPGPSSDSNASTSTPATSVFLNVHNDTGASVVSVFISPCESEHWGLDKLDSPGRIGAGKVRIWQLSAGCYDLKARMSDEEDVSLLHVRFYGGTRMQWRIFQPSQGFYRVGRIS
jgi:hypothetical protein